jgi:transcriptional regulator with XRE-family HTH domain
MKKRTSALSEKIQEHLAARNMTQSQLARRLDISDSYLSNLLSGNNRMSVERALQIAAILYLSQEQTAELSRLVQAESDGAIPLETREDALSPVLQKATALITGIDTLQVFLHEKKERIQHGLAQFQDAIARLQEEVASIDALLSFPELQRIQQANNSQPTDVSGA